MSACGCAQSRIHGLDIHLHYSAALVVQPHRVPGSKAAGDPSRPEGQRRTTRAHDGSIDARRATVNNSTNSAIGEPDLLITGYDVAGGQPALLHLAAQP